MDMKRVLISDKLSQRAKEIFQNNGVNTDVKLGLSENDLIEIIKDYDGLVVRSLTKVTENIFVPMLSFNIFFINIFTPYD